MVFPILPSVFLVHDSHYVFNMEDNSVFFHQFLLLRNMTNKNHNTDQNLLI